MHALGMIASGAFYTFIILLMIGLYRPWIVLWWLDHQNRLKVIRYYGAAALIALLAKVLL